MVNEKVSMNRSTKDIRDGLTIEQRHIQEKTFGSMD